MLDKDSKVRFFKKKLFIDSYQVKYSPRDAFFNYK